MVDVCVGGELWIFFSHGGRGENGSAKRSPGFGRSSGRRVVVDIPAHLKDEWTIWRVASSNKFSDSLIDIETLWSLDDLCDANDVLDVLEELERRQNTSP